MGGGGGGNNKGATIDPVGEIVGRDHGALNALNPASMLVPPEQQQRQERARRNTAPKVTYAGFDRYTDDDETLLG